MKLLIGTLAVFLILGTVEGGRRDSGPRDLKTGQNLRKQKARMLQTNKVPKPLANEPKSENEALAEPVGGMLSPCEDCKALVSKIDAVLKDKAKREELKAMLNLLCDMAPSSYRDECKEVVENLDKLAEEIEPLLSNPELFCQEIHLCGNGRISRVMQFSLLFVKKYVYQVDNPRSSNDLLCEECTVVIAELKTLVEDKSIQDEIEAELKSICAMLGSIKEECDSLVDQFFPTLIAELEQLLSDPHKVCVELGLCSSMRMAIEGFPVTQPRQGRVTPNIGLNRFRFLISRLHTRDGMNVGCVMCKFSISTLVDAIKDDDSIIDGIVNDMKLICNLMPEQQIRPGCVDFLDTYAKAVIILTLNEINSKQICQDFHLCSDHELSEIRENRRNRNWKNEVVCESCKLLADFLKHECRQRSFQEALANEAKQLCDLIPGKFAISVSCKTYIETYMPYVLQVIGTVLDEKKMCQCDNLMDQYIPYIIQLLVDQLDPNTVCPELHLCTSGRSDQELQEITEE